MMLFLITLFFISLVNNFFPELELHKSLCNLYVLEKPYPRTSDSYTQPCFELSKSSVLNSIACRSMFAKKTHKKKGALPAPFLSNQTLTILLRYLETHFNDTAVF